MSTIKVNLFSPRNRNYDIIISNKNLEKFGEEIPKRQLGDSAFIISNPPIYELYGNKVCKSLQKSGIKKIDKYLLPQGEKFKSFQYYKKTLDALVNFDDEKLKDIFIVNLGGGVISDLGGFVAATYKRGISYVQIPTTLLAFVDSTIGGKVAVDYGNKKPIKNLVGTFYQPSLVFGDLQLLNTLPKLELKSGFAEIIKYGVIDDENLFELLEKKYKQLLSLDTKLLSEVVTLSCKIKAKIVQEDEFDRKGIRAKLNFGHTIGHAIESVSDFKYRHGEAIAIGMICAAEIACELSMFSKESCKRLVNLVHSFGLPTTISNCKGNDIIQVMMYDKKFKGGTNKFILPVTIGKVKVISGVNYNLIRKVLFNRIYKP
ncbi:MAG: 3-dehydroquinate synthase [Candidatus Firestonebacteria bacterium]